MTKWVLLGFLMSGSTVVNALIIRNETEENQRFSINFYKGEELLFNLMPHNFAFPHKTLNFSLNTQQSNLLVDEISARSNVTVKLRWEAWSGPESHSCVLFSSLLDLNELEKEFVFPDACAQYVETPSEPS